MLIADSGVANTSHHVHALARAGLVERRDGTGIRIVYRLASPQLEALWWAARDVATSNVPEIAALADGYLGNGPASRRPAAPSSSGASR